MEKVINDAAILIKQQLPPLLAAGWRVKSIWPYSRQYTPDAWMGADSHARAPRYEDCVWVVLERDEAL